MVLALSSLSVYSLSTQSAEKGRERKNKGLASLSHLKEMKAIDGLEEIENHSLEGFVIAGGWSNRLSLARIEKGEGDGLVVGRDNSRRTSTARRLP